ncbi:MAG: hypothetical protein LBJ96_04710 [Holosporaceae bacterium]|jgi:hypothetical protein|nr:hypothetical protein [Holosporaceae bacterium]
MMKKLIFLCGMLGMSFPDVLCMKPKPIDGQNHVVFASSDDPRIFNKTNYSPAV